MTRSPEGRSIDLLTISSHDFKSSKFETYLKDIDDANNGLSKGQVAYKFHFIFENSLTFFCLFKI